MAVEARRQWPWSGQQYLAERGVIYTRVDTRGNDVARLVERAPTFFTAHIHLHAGAGHLGWLTTDAVLSAIATSL